jgi:uncharacterized protein
VAVALDFHRGQRELQARFDTERLADRLGGVAAESFSPEYERFITARDMFFIATTDTDGFPDCSYKGGAPGFVRIVDERTLAFPSYDGNGMFRTLGNIQVNPRVGLLFVELETGTRLRLNGEATVHLDDELVASYPGALCAVSVRATAIFANCRRYVHEYRKVVESPFVPDATGDAPVPDWKRHEWFDGTLAATDAAHDPAHPTAPAIPIF